MTKRWMMTTLGLQKYSLPKLENQIKKFDFGVLKIKWKIEPGKEFNFPFLIG